MITKRGWAQNVVNPRSFLSNFWGSLQIATPSISNDVKNRLESIANAQQQLAAVMFYGYDVCYVIIRMGAVVGGTVIWDERAEFAFFDCHLPCQVKVPVLYRVACAQREAVCCLPIGIVG